MRIRTIKESQDYISFSDSPVLTNELSVHEKFDKETIAERFVDLDFERRVGLQLYESQ